MNDPSVALKSQVHFKLDDLEVCN